MSKDRNDETVAEERRAANQEFNASVDNIHREFIQDLMIQYLVEKKKSRRWTTFKRVFITFLLLSGILIYTGSLAGSLGYRLMPTSDAVAVVSISGVIAKHTEASADSVITVLERMFDSDNVTGIVLKIDSGGGSPSEAERITRFIDAEKKRTGKTVIAACASMCASAAYMIAIHADRVYAGEYTWTGSIGAIMKGWNFDGVMKRFDIDQRVFASGPLKDLMNPYAEMSPAMSEKLGALVDSTAQTFGNEVREFRGEKLNGGNELFTGEVWTGRDSLELGLIDAIGTLEDVLATEFDGQPHSSYQPKKRGNTLFDRVLGNIGEGFARVLIDSHHEVQL